MGGSSSQLTPLESLIRLLETRRCARGNATTVTAEWRRRNSLGIVVNTFQTTSGGILGWWAVAVSCPQVIDIIDFSSLSFDSSSELLVPELH
jgi:hypothetical protein